MDHISQFQAAMKKVRVDTQATSPKSTGASSASAADWTLGFDADWPAGPAARECLKRARARVAHWVNGDVLALVLAGGPGAGKSHLARAAVARFGDPLEALLVAEPDLNADIRATYDGEGSERAVIARLRRSLRLVLDDVGTAPVKSHQWWQSIFWRILDRRAERSMPLMLTTNLALPELAEWLGARAASRLGDMLDDESNFVDMFCVPDYRMRNWGKKGD